MDGGTLIVMLLISALVMWIGWQILKFLKRNIWVVSIGVAVVAMFTSDAALAASGEQIVIQGVTTGGVFAGMAKAMIV